MTQPQSVPTIVTTKDVETLMDIGAWLAQLHLSQYEGRFRRAGITSEAKLWSLTHDTLRTQMNIRSKVHRDRILAFVAEHKHAYHDYDPHHHNLNKNVMQHRRTDTSLAELPLTLPLARTDCDDDRSANVTSAAWVSTADIKLPKHIRSLFFLVCRWMEERQITLEDLFAEMQSKERENSHHHLSSFVPMKYASKARFAHVLRSADLGLSSAQLYVVD
jgi:hypothetical protein